MQISRFTSSKPSKFAFASDEKSIRRPTTSFARPCLKINPWQLIRMLYLGFGAALIFTGGVLLCRVRLRRAC